jgi:hypothetical protein
MLRMRTAFFAVLIASGFSQCLLGDSCQQLAKLKLTRAVVLSAESIAAGGFLPSGVSAGSPDAQPYKKLPAFCRAAIEATPNSDSQIALEIWLPVTGWNHKYRGQGNGGFAGAIDYRGMAGSVELGYATSGSDAGHKGEGTDASWALNHPEKIVDFGYRAVHETAGIAKVIIKAFYGEPQQRAYFDSCSDGGREALMEAQRFPEDYDGILAGAPANDWTHLMTGALTTQKAINANRANFIPPEKLPAITAAALQACDAQDGLRDGILSDPRRCHFDPGMLLCGPSDDHSCLSAPQLQSLKTIYAGPTDPQGRQIFPAVMPSGEDGDGGWKDWIIGPTFEKSALVAFESGFFQDMVFSDRNWNYHSADIDQSLQAANQKMASVLNATDPDLSKFKARGGKLILYHGWLDAAISPVNTINYYQSVQSKMGEQSAGEFVKLYMVPGMRHCVSGPGPSIFGQLGIAMSRDPQENMFTSLERWVEQGTAPNTIIATKLRDERDRSKGILMTRPLCPFPELAVYDGKGDPQNATAFACAKQQN